MNDIGFLERRLDTRHSLVDEQDIRFHWLYLRVIERSYSGTMLALLATCAHLSVSASRNWPNSSGVPP